MLVDTHCHLADSRFDTDRREVIERARRSGVGHVIIIADSAPNAEQVVALAKRAGLSASAGVHPHEAGSWNAETAARIEAWVDDPTVVAVGETGLDYHYEHAPRPAQRRAFGAQLDLAAERDLPVIVHARAADEDMVAMLADAQTSIVLHSFSSGRAVLDVALESDAYVSFSGMVTFRSWKDLDAVTRVPLDRLLVETDAPYLAPVPHRGRRNEPAFVQHVAQRVAELRGVSLQVVEAATTANAIRCFGNRITPHPDSA